MPMILFDIDGTLLLTGGAGRVSLNRAFEDFFKVPNAYEGISPDGKTDDAIFREMHERAIARPMADRDLPALRERYISYFLADLPRGERFRVLPGARELVTALSVRSDCLLGIVTGNYEATARAKLARAGLQEYFSFGGYGSDSEHRTQIVKQAIARGQVQSEKRFEPRDIFVVGDSPADVRSARQAGAQAIAVASGSTSPQALAAERPAAVLKNLEDPQAFLTLLGQTPKGQAA